MRWWHRLWVRGPALGATTFALSLLAVHLRPEGSQTAVWWPAGAVAIAVLSLARRSERPTLGLVVLVASAAANAAAGRPLLVAAGFGVANAVEAWLVTWLFTRRTEGAVRFRSLEDASRLLVAGAVGAAVTGLLAALTALALGAPFPTTLSTVAFAHAAAVLIAVPPLLLRPSAVRLPGRRAEAAAQSACLALTTLAVFSPGQRLPLTFLSLPFLVWGAVRLSARTSAVQLLVVAVVTSLATLHGAGPLADVAVDRAGAAVPLLQAYLVSYGLVLLPLAMAVQQRRESVARLRASEELFRLSFDEALVGMVVLRHSGDDSDGLVVLRGNDVAARVLGRPPADLPGTAFCSMV
jgi:integral membrane sensor domain MASE1